MDDTHINMLRAGDADREKVADKLRKHHADGRLDTEEFQERINRCLQAKTLGELEAVVADLPGERRASGRQLRPRRWWSFPLVPAVIVLVALSAGSGWHNHGHGHWLWFWVVIGVGFLAARFAARRHYAPWPGRRYRDDDDDPML
jgi:hypothetical protein